VIFDPATPAEPPIGRDVHRRVDPIAAAVLACPLVAGLHGGRHGHVATYLPGRRVTGIRITEDEVSIHLVAHYPAAMDEVARQVRNAVAPFTAGLAVQLTIEDLSTSDVRTDDTPSAPPARPVRVPETHYVNGRWIVIDKER
jgi:hypothetical protein